MTETETLGARLARLRHERGESLRKAAPLIGCAHRHLHQLEHGPTANPTLATLQALARHYGVTVAYLVAGIGRG